MNPRQSKFMRAVLLMSTFVAALACGLAAIVRHIEQPQMVLDDGSVWVTSQFDRQAVRFNVRNRQSNAVVPSQSNHVDVLQSGSSTVMVQERAAINIDAATLDTSTPTAVPRNITLLMNGPTIAAFDTQTGDVWRGSADDMQSLDFRNGTPLLQLGAHAQIAVDFEGTVYGYRSDNATVWSVKLGETSSHQIASLHQGRSLIADSFTVVHRTPVVASGSTIYWPHGSAQIDVASMHKNTANKAIAHDELPVQLQQSPSDAVQQHWVAAATAYGLVTVPLRVGQQTASVLQHGSQSSFTQPVSVQGCVHAAWSQQLKNYVRLCEAQDRAQFVSLEQISKTSNVVFRTNHRLVVLNDVAAGRVWHPQSGVEAITVQSSADASELTEQHDATAQHEHTVAQFKQAPCSENFDVLHARDDEFGIRAHNHATVDVLRNDELSQCAVLQIAEISAVTGEHVAVAIAHDGRTLQVDASQAQPGQASWNYTINDGQGHTSTARVQLHIVGSGNHAPRVADAQEHVEVEQGSSTEINALASFIDDDGDSLLLEHARIENTDEAEVSIRPDGMLRVFAGTMSSGTMRIRITVSDGQASTSDLVMATVCAAHSLSPRVDPMLFRATVNTPVHIDLEKYVHGNAADPVKLAEISAPEHATVSRNVRALSFSLQAQEAGTVVVRYSVAQGTHTTTGIARFEVQAHQQHNAAPIAVNDFAFVDSTQTAIIEPLHNDIDPEGGVLTVTEVVFPSDQACSAGIQRNNRIYVVCTALPEQPMPFTYTIANASHTAQGTITLLAKTAESVPAMIYAPPIEVSVKNRGIVSVDVFDYVANEFSDIELVDVQPREDEQFNGVLFTSGTQIRFQSTDTSGVVDATYRLRNSAHQEASGSISFHVHERDAEDKPAPQPRIIEAQVTAGERQLIQIPLIGIDADGDDVQLLGLGNTQPTLGRVVEVSADALVYEAFADQTGTDEFSYAVEDWTGQRAQGLIRVGVYQQNHAQPVLARDDAIVLRPNTTASVPVLANDLGCNDEPLSLQSSLDVQGLDDAQVEDNAIVVHTPAYSGTGYIQYVAQCSTGLTASAMVTVTVDIEAPIAAPEVWDIDVPAVDTIGKRTVEVDLQHAMRNPSGPLEDLRVSVHESAHHGAQLSSSQCAACVVVTLGDEALSIPVIVTNTVHHTSSMAFIHVPAYGVFPPMLRPKTPTVQVRAGDAVTLDIRDFVRVGPGKLPWLDRSQSPTATKAAQQPTIEDAHKLTFVADEQSGGEASISFFVTDTDPESIPEQSRVQTAWITVPISIVPLQARPPTLTALSVDVEAGGQPVTIDLHALTHAHESSSQPLTYTGGLDNTCIHATVTHDGTATIRAASSCVIPTTDTVPIRVTSTHAAVLQTESAITVHVTAPKQPLARLQPQHVQIHAGQSADIDIAAQAFNPFPDQPLPIVDAQASDTALQVSFQRSILHISTTEQTAAGSYTIHVTVQDVSHTVSRQVTTTVQLDVQARPSPPLLMVSETVVQSGVVTVHWIPGQAHGSSIEQYQVEWQSGSQLCGNQTSCTIQGLKNGVTYEFRVRAQNAVGWSELSNSVQARPDAVPTAPTHVVLEGGYRSAHVSWRAPQYEGSAVQAYAVTIHSADGTAKTVETTQTAIAIEIPMDGTYTATVRARNQVGEGALSAPSTSAQVWSDPQPPTVTIEQEPDSRTVHGMVMVHDLHGAGCSAIELSRGQVNCNGGSFSFTVESHELFHDLNVQATLIPSRPHAASAQAQSNTIQPGVPIGTAAVTVARDDARTCTVQWQVTGNADTVRVIFGSAFELHELTGSRQLLVEALQACPAATIMPMLNGREGTPVTATEPEHQGVQDDPLIDQNSPLASRSTLLHGRISHSLFVNSSFATS
ncbi:ATPase AAA [Bifidobacterium dolichotidis]|uniref:ATPase AAA n=1 Tax=Bifidobacterium dolichotidis TaxID=2306976 RepID=A0A430FRS6_9BIFI|nr:Ig-like domain-containing protein [Bifidobacterium dolichotidis]RSX55569.1 ATPase AAA [Bifidobacterium dolichotidis]